MKTDKIERICSVLNINPSPTQQQMLDCPNYVEKSCVIGSCELCGGVHRQSDPFSHKRRNTEDLKCPGCGRIESTLSTAYCRECQCMLQRQDESLKLNSEKSDDGLVTLTFRDIYNLAGYMRTTDEGAKVYFGNSHARPLTLTREQCREFIEVLQRFIETGCILPCNITEQES